MVAGLLAVAAAAAAGGFVGFDSGKVRYLGRHVVGSQAVEFDWVATGVQMSLRRCGSGDANGEVLFELISPTARFDVYTGVNRTALTQYDFWVHKAQARTNFSVIPASALSTSSTVITVVKATEPFVFGTRPTQFFGMHLPEGVCADAAPAPARRKVDLYGDSDSAAFGVEGDSRKLIKCLENMEVAENWGDGWVRGALSHLGGDIDIRNQAVSGIGVVQNAAFIGTATVSTKTMPEILRRNLQTVDNNDYPAGDWLPDLVLVFIGGNDFTVNIPPSKAKFTATYDAMTSSILSLYPKKVPVLHICGGDPGATCEYVQEVATNRSEAFTTTFDNGQKHTGCIGHRNLTQQATLASKIAPVISKVAGW
eukprot:Hpha_TRINITY_DN13198_c0_g1::TRINITY_DN13198_c0_g1_i1::g.113370::m.113370